ncbi:MAG: succinate dehydrogenase cytochrome b subunit [Hyphomicrobiales bacterium]
MNKSGLHYSSVTKKIIMSLAGLFLLTFLIVHLSINLLILFDPTRQLFNQAAHFMGTNPFIQTFQWVLFIGFIIHIVYGVILVIQNKKARPVKYKVSGTSEESWTSRYMFHTGIIIFIFLIIHLVNFFFKKMAGDIPEVVYDNVILVDGNPIPLAPIVLEDMGLLVVNLFHHLGYVIFYVVCILLLGFHLNHAFQSAFQSLGIRHSVYTPAIEIIGRIIAIIVTIGFIIIPIIIYFGNY